MPAGAQRFDAKASVLIESVTYHIEEEEQDWFPRCGPVSAQTTAGTRGQTRASPEESTQIACPAQCAEKDGRRRHPLTLTGIGPCRRGWIASRGRRL
jgi:hypothetical protein